MGSTKSKCRSQHQLELDKREQQRQREYKDLICLLSLPKNKFILVKKKYQQKKLTQSLFVLQDLLPTQLQKTIIMEYLYQEIK